MSRAPRRLGRRLPRRLLAWSALALAALLGPASCGGPQALGSARQVVARWFDVLAARDAEAALALYVAPAAEAEALRSRLEELARRGAPDARRERSWELHARASDDAPGWFVTLVEEARWGECRLTLRFLVHQPFGADGGEGDPSRARLVRHERVAEEGCDAAGLAV